MSASVIAVLASAMARAACIGPKPCFAISSSMKTSQRDDGASVAQKRAVSACAAVRDRPIWSSSFKSVVKRALPGSGGGPGRYTLPDGSTHVFHEPAVGSNGDWTRFGGVGFHAHASFGIDPVHAALDPSVDARA